MSDELSKNTDIHKIATEGSKIYEVIKSQYEPAQNGKFLAIDIDTKKVYFADTSIGAMDRAKKDFPHKVFYLVKIGYDAAETIAKMFYQIPR